MTLGHLISWQGGDQSQAGLSLGDFQPQWFWDFVVPPCTSCVRSFSVPDGAERVFMKCSSTMRNSSFRGNNTGNSYWERQSGTLNPTSLPPLPWGHFPPSQVPPSPVQAGLGLPGIQGQPRLLSGWIRALCCGNDAFRTKRDSKPSKAVKCEEIDVACYITGQKGPSHTGCLGSSWSCCLEFCRSISLPCMAKSRPQWGAQSCRSCQGSDLEIQMAQGGQSHPAIPPSGHKTLCVFFN